MCLVDSFQVLKFSSLHSFQVSTQFPSLKFSKSLVSKSPVSKSQVFQSPVSIFQVSSFLISSFPGSSFQGSGLKDPVSKFPSLQFPSLQFLVPMLPQVSFVVLSGVMTPCNWCVYLQTLSIRLYRSKCVCIQYGGGGVRKSDLTK